jgi:hypothetical protein
MDIIETRLVRQRRKRELEQDLLDAKLKVGLYFGRTIIQEGLDRSREEEARALRKIPENRHDYARRSLLKDEVDFLAGAVEFAVSDEPDPEFVDSESSPSTSLQSA